MEAFTADVTDTSETIADAPQLTIPCQERPAGPARPADTTVTARRRRRAKAMPVNQFAHLDSTAIGDTATSSTAYAEPSLPAPRSQHQGREKPPKEQRPPLYAQQLTLQAMTGANNGLDITPLGGFVPKTGLTKLKTVTREEEKTEDYMVKRQRNNMSAKKSRDNRKTMEERIRKEVAKLEEANSSMDQEIADIKKREGLPLNKSVMTPKEREQCNTAIERWVTYVKKTGNLFFDKGKATPERVPRPAERFMEASVTESAEEAAVSSDAGEKEEEASPNLTYGPSVYGPFVPPPSWNPVVVQPQYGIIPFPNPRHRNELPQESVVPLDYFVNRGMAALMPAPYGYFVSPIVPGNQMLHGASSEGRSYSNIAPNAGVICGNGQEEQRGNTDGGALNLRMSRSLELPTNATQSFVNSTKHMSYLGDASSIMSSSARFSSQLHTLFKVPLPVNAFSYRQPAEGATSNDQYGFKVKRDRPSKPKNARLKKAHQSMSMDME